MTQDEKLSKAQIALIEGDATRASMLYEEILQESPDNIYALDGLGILRCRDGEIERGIEFFYTALRLCDGFLSAETSVELKSCRATLLHHLGLALLEFGKVDEAIAALQESVELLHEDTNNSEPLLALGQLFFNAQRFSEAAECFQKLTDREPQNPSAWLTLGYIHFQLENHTQAISALQRAEELDSASPDACFYLAESLRKAERFEESLRPYQRLLGVATEWPQAVHGYGKSLLALGYLEDGWEAMEFRLACTFGSWERHLLPNWNGAPDERKTVLAYSEEGIAADILFASCLPDIVNSVGHCVIECDHSLHGIFRRSFPRATVVPLTEKEIGAVDSTGNSVCDSIAGSNNPWGVKLDEQIAFGSLPRHFRKKREDFPMRKTYLVPDKSRRERWSNRLAEIGGMPKIGVLWQGSWTAENERQTSLPLADLRNLMLKNQASAAWICLQHGSRQKDIEQYRRNVSLRFRLFSEAFQYDLDEMAALLSELDLVVTPPGYVAHLAGAIGTKTWLVLSAEADWRWNIGVATASTAANKEFESEQSLWHPSMRCYRQKKNESWSNLFQRLGDDLEKFLVTHRPPEEAIEPILSMSFEEARQSLQRRIA